MGWCSATQIMDRALAAAEQAVRSAVESVLGPDDRRRLIKPQFIDDALRPFVAGLAAELRDGDWDCIEESDYFERFPQEMLGHDDDEHEKWLVEAVREQVEYGNAPDVIAASEKLATFRQRKGRK